jgi:hypothetical protein
VKKGEFVFYICIIIISGILIINSYNYPNLSGRLPRIILSLLFILAIIKIIIAYLKKGKEFIIKSKKIILTNSKRRLIFIIISLILYIIGLIFLGFYISTIIFFIFIPQYLGYESIKFRIITIFVFLVFMYLMFEKLLNTPLPTGVFGI